jgi:hypothetical protein
MQLFKRELLSITLLRQRYSMNNQIQLDEQLLATTVHHDTKSLNGAVLNYARFCL